MSPRDKESIRNNLWLRMAAMPPQMRVAARAKPIVRLMILHLRALDDAAQCFVEGRRP